MITILICMIIGLGIGIKNIISEFGSYTFDLFLNIFLTIIMGMGGAFIGIIIAIALPTKHVTVEKVYELECLKDNSSISGDFFLGMGSVDSTMKYTFYYKTEDGFKLKQLDVDSTIIKYSENTPRAICSYEKEVNVEDAFINYFAIDFSFGKWVIEIPKGSITNSYKLDAE